MDVRNIPVERAQRPLQSGIHEVIVSLRGETKRQSVDVRPGENDPLQVVVGSGAGTVSGLVQDGAAKAVAGAAVALIPEAAHRGNLALYLSAATDASGRFVMRGVPPGDYKLFAWESVRPFAYQNAAFIAKDEDRGRSIHVAQGNTVKAELSIIH